MLAAAVAAGTVAAPLAGVAGAAPSNAKTATPVTISCSNGETYDAVVNSGQSDGNTFSPAITTLGHTVLVPVAFGPSTFTLTDLDTNTVIDTQTDPGGQAKGPGATTRANVLDCTFELSGTFVSDGSDGLVAGHTYEFSGTGSVSGFIPSQK